MKQKVWPLVFCCLSTGAVHCELASTYNTDSFLLCYNTYASRRGAPQSVYTDKGSQLQRAATTVTENPVSWDWERVERATADSGTTWRFCPASSQWRNGLAENRVKKFKAALDLLVPTGLAHLNYPQL